MLSGKVNLTGEEISFGLALHEAREFLSVSELSVLDSGGYTKLVKTLSPFLKVLLVPA